MTTTTTHTIGTSSRDYSTIQAWEDAAPSSLVTADVVWKGVAYNDSEFTAGVIFSGVATDATRLMWLTVAAGQSIFDSTANPPDYDQSKGVGIRVTGSYVTIITDTGGVDALLERFQLYYDSTYSSNYYVPVTTGNNFNVNRCLFKSRRTAGDGFRISQTVNSFYLQLGTTFSGVTLVAAAGGIVSSNTIVRPSDLLRGGTGIGGGFLTNPPMCKNNRVFGFTTAFGGTLSDYPVGTTDNASDLSNANIPGANPHGSLTDSDQFIGPVSFLGFDLRPKAGSQLGTRDVTYTADLDAYGQARSTTTPTTGAAELVGSPDVTLALAGTASTGAAGFPLLSVAKGLTGSAGTSAAGSVGRTTALALAGTQATSGTGALGLSRTLAVTGQSATSTAGAVGAGGDAAASLTGLAAASSAGSIGATTSSALTGQAATASAGTPSISHAQTTTGAAATAAAGAIGLSASKALTGQASTASAGTFGLSHDQATTGAAATASAGTLAPSQSKALSGSAATSAAGTASVTHTQAATGQAAAAASGTVLTGNDATAPLTGTAATTAAGTVTPSRSTALAGASATVAQGTQAIMHAQAVTGQGATASAGTVTASAGAGSALSGTAATASPGTVSNAVSVGLTGITCALTAGSVSLSRVLAGSEIFLSAGTMTGSRSIALAGASATAQAGSMTASGGETVPVAESVWWAYSVPVDDLRISVAVDRLNYSVSR